jgi:hypothetical protein
VSTGQHPVRNNRPVTGTGRESPWRFFGGAEENLENTNKKIGVFSTHSVSSQFRHFIRLLDTVNVIKQLKKYVSGVLTTVVKLNYKDCIWEPGTRSRQQRASGFL